MSDDGPILWLDDCPRRTAWFRAALPAAHLTETAAGMIALLDALDAGKISVGPPYFGLLFALLLVPLVILLPMGFHARWQEDRLGRLLRQLAVPGIFAVLGGIWMSLSVLELTPRSSLSPLAEFSCTPSM